MAPPGVISGANPPAVIIGMKDTIPIVEKSGTVRGREFLKAPDVAVNVLSQSIYSTDDSCTDGSGRAFRSKSDPCRTQYPQYHRHGLRSVR